MVIRRDGRTDGFFDGALNDQLMIKRCAHCRAWHAPDTTSCASCLSEKLDWTESRGLAHLVSWAFVHSKDGSGSRHIALVELDEGPWLYAALDGVEWPQERLALKAHFVHPEEGEPYLVFRAL